MNSLKNCLVCWSLTFFHRLALLLLAFTENRESRCYGCVGGGDLGRTTVLIEGKDQKGKEKSKEQGMSRALPRARAPSLPSAFSLLVS